jgi:hypothetical protein
MASLPAWVSSEEFEGAMFHAPCGCDLIHKAQRDPDPDAAEALERDARDAQQRWRCPFAGHPEPGRTGAPPLDDAAREALARTERVTGLKALQRAGTCPRWYAAQPFARETCRARAAAERGETAMRYGGDPPAVLIAGVDALDAAHAERVDADIQRMKRKTPPPPSRSDD